MIDLSSATFLIAVRIDSSDRLENLEIVIGYLIKHFNASISVMEVDYDSKVSNFIKNNSHYIFRESEDPIFRHTQINNELIHACRTTVAIIYDVDVILPPTQLEKSLQLLTLGNNSFSIPYDGTFQQVDYYNKRLFKNNLDISFLESGHDHYATFTKGSVGGCFVLDVSEYKKCGMDNENIVGYGHEDIERYQRLKKLGYSIPRVEGTLYHLYHSRGRNSYFFDDKTMVKSYEEFFKTCSLSGGELTQEIAAWPWSYLSESKEEPSYG